MAGAPRKGVAPDCDADCGFASGIFTLRLGRTDEECARQTEETIDALDRTSKRGLAFNCLTSNSDPGKMRDYLYSPGACAVFDRYKRRHSANVALLQDCGLFAFTVLVQKDVAAPSVAGR